jgi:hypothetical protein
MRKLFIIFVVLAVLSFSTGAVIAEAEKEKPKSQPQPTVKLIVCEPETITVDEPQPVYFDIPLAHDVQDHIFAECEKYNISPAVVIAMIEHESKFNTYALGDDGRSAGLMQIQAKWHLQRMIDLNCTDLFNPQQNITVGIDILDELLQRYDDIAKALVAYNQGSYKGTVTNYANTVLEIAKRIDGDVSGNHMRKEDEGK